MSSFDEKELEDLYLHYQNRFVRFTEAYIRDEFMAEDIVEESIMYCWENRERLPHDVNIQASVLTVIKHKCIDFLRKEQLHKAYSDICLWELSVRIKDLESVEPYSIFSKEIHDITHETLNKLPDKTRNIFIMSRIEGKKIQEIATHYCISVKAVEFHISKALKLLRIALRDYLLFVTYFL